MANRRGKSVIIQRNESSNLQIRDPNQPPKFPKIDIQKACYVKIVICEGKLKMDEDFQEFYKIDPQVELKYRDKSYVTNIARIGIFRPIFNHTFKFNVYNLEDTIELNLYILSISRNVPMARRTLQIKDLINVQGEPINKWVNIFKQTATEQKKETYSGRIRMKIAAVNVDQKKLIEVINNPKYLLKTRIQSFKKPATQRHNSIQVDQIKGLSDANLDKDDEEDDHGKKDDQDSLQTDSSEDAIKSDKFSCSDHSHGDEEENHDLILMGLAAPKRKIDKKCCILYPDDNIAMVWEGFISIILLISCFTTPISLAFPNLEAENKDYRLFSIIIDLIFLLEIIINYRYAYEDDTYQIIDDYKQIARRYVNGWFFIDVTAIFPIDIILEAAMDSESGQSGNANQFIRMSRIGKLYKLVRVTRLLRLIKMAKSKGNLMSQIGQQFKLGEGFERLLFSIVIFIIFSHFSACFWIFTAGLSNPDEQQEEDPTMTNWIISGEYTELSDVQLYTTSFYFTITTMTTVGYGDISGTNTSERIVCCILMIMGVLFFTYVSGTITNIITNEEEENKIYQEKKMHLNKLYKKHGKSMRSELYIELLHTIKFSSNNDLEEFNDFIETLPTKLKNECILLIHRPTYSAVTFLQYKPKQFLAWICPKLKPQLIQQDQFIYVDNEPVEGIYFLVKGAAGYVLKESKSQQNIIYIEISQGDDFGQVDVISFAVDNQINLQKVFDYKDVIKRQFNCQTLTEVEIMLVDFETLKRMMHEFYEGFEALFTDADIRLRRILKQKLRAINLCEKGMIEYDHEEQFRLRFKNQIRQSKSHKDDKNEESEEEKFNHHHHEKAQECYSKIAFFKQSIPIKRLMERSLSETMSTPADDSENSESQEDSHNQTEERKESALNGLRVLFNKKEQQQDNTVVKNKTLRDLKDVFSITKKRLIKDGNAIDLQKGLNQKLNAAAMKIKKQKSEKKPIEFKFKEDNKDNIMKKIQELSDKKNNNFELLSKDGNPLLQRLAQTIKEKVETHRSNIIQQQNSLKNNQNENNEGNLNDGNQFKNGQSQDQQQDQINQPENQTEGVKDFLLTAQRVSKVSLKNTVPIQEEAESQAIMTDEQENISNQKFQENQQESDIFSQTQPQQVYHGNYNELTNQLTPKQQKTANVIGQGFMSPTGSYANYQPSMMGAVSNQSYEIQAPQVMELQAQLQQQQMVHQSQMIQNMGVMFKTLNMMEEYHANQMNEMRNQINVLSNNYESTSKLNVPRQRQMNQTSTKKRIKLDSLNYDNGPSEPYNQGQTNNSNQFQTDDVAEPDDNQEEMQDQFEVQQIIEEEDDVADGIQIDPANANSRNIQNQESDFEDSYNNMIDQLKDVQTYEWSKTTSQVDAQAQKNQQEVMIDDQQQDIHGKQKIIEYQSEQKIKENENNIEKNENLKIIENSIDRSKTPKKKRIIKAELISGRKGITMDQLTPKGSTPKGSTNGYKRGGGNLEYQKVQVMQSFKNDNSKDEAIQKSRQQVNSFSNMVYQKKSTDSGEIDLPLMIKHQLSRKSSNQNSKEVKSTSRKSKIYTDIKIENANSKKQESTVKEVTLDNVNDENEISIKKNGKDI